MYNFIHAKGSLKVVNSENRGGVRNVENCPYISGTVTMEVYLKFSFKPYISLLVLYGPRTRQFLKNREHAQNCACSLSKKISSVRQ